jgi:phosphatidylserine decarboxylase
MFLGEDINFLLTNRIPRQLATRIAGRLCRVETGRLTPLGIAIWRLFARDLDLSEAKETRFRSLHDCFVRELRRGARPVDPDPAILTSPCDAIVGAFGRARDTEVFQAKGYPYRLEELLGDHALVDRYRNGTYVTLRIKSSFYHRFHAPCDAELERVIYISGDTWNVNPVALRRVEHLFCKNERAVLQLTLPGSRESLALVAVAAVLVASIRIHALEETLNLRYRGPNVIPCRAAFSKGQELGWFENGSTILVFTPPGFEPCDGIHEGVRIRMGQPLLTLLRIRASKKNDAMEES